MKIEIKVDDKLIDDIMGNFPEAGMCLTCVSFKYDGLKFQFWDHEVTPDTKQESVVPATIVDLNLTRSGLVKNAVTYKLTRKEIEAGFKILVQKLANGELNGLSISKGNIAEPGDWDAFDADALVQCAIFGDVIYG